MFLFIIIISHIKHANVNALKIICLLSVRMGMRGVGVSTKTRTLVIQPQPEILIVRRNILWIHRASWSLACQSPHILYSTPSPLIQISSR